MKKWGILYLMVIFAVGCVTTPIEPEKFGTVKVIKKEEILDEKTGDISIRTTVVEEKAEKSIVDKGAEALMTPQRYANVGTFFGYYDVGPDNSVLASIYNQNESKGSDIWLFKGGRVRLTKTDYQHNHPSFSRDGSYVYFASTRGKEITRKYGQDSYIWRMSSTGAGGITRIGTAAYSYTYPDESPNGKYILYSSRELYGNSNFVWYMNKNGALPTQLKQGIDPKWISDDKIVFADKDENTGRYTIWTSKTDGSMLTQIITDKEMGCIHPEPSSDGAYIAYVKQAKDEKTGDSRDIYIYRFADGLSQQITTNKSRDDLPKWSQDGKYIFFRSSRGVGWNIWRLSTSFLSE